MQSADSSRNALQLGIFGANCSHGLTLVDIPGAWDASWDNNVKLAIMADDAGFECLVPNARWKGYGGNSNVNLHSFESLAWACGLLAHTKRTTVFATVHVPLVHPVFAAKQMVTADHIGHGRFGLNIVCGANEAEFNMFGTTAGGHDARYDLGADWLQLVRKLWSADEPFDYKSDYFDLKGLISKPAPYDGTIPIMNAGGSPAGRDFAVKHSDFHYDICLSPEISAPRIAEAKALARQGGNQIQSWTAASVVCRSTEREVDEFLQYCVEHGDWEAVDRRDTINTAAEASQTISAQDIARIRRQEQARAVIGRAHYPLFGTPDRVADLLAELHHAGFDGVAIGFVDYCAELPFFIQEVLPRLERRGLRAAASVPAGELALS